MCSINGLSSSRYSQLLIIQGWTFQTQGSVCCGWGHAGAGSAWAGFISGGAQACPASVHSMFLTACRVPAGGFLHSTLISNTSLLPLHTCSVFLWPSFAFVLHHTWVWVTPVIQVWEFIRKSWWFPAVFSWHFLCANLLGDYIKSRSEIKNANFKVITYMWI